MKKHFKLAGAGLMGVAAALVAACGGSSTTTTVVETSGGGSGSSGNTEPGGVPLKAPSGSDTLKTSDRNGVEYARYANSKLTPKEVVSDYNSEAKAAGWEIVRSNGGGGGWGPYGGSDYGMIAKKGSNYFAVQAGGEKGNTTYFEACAGPDADDCHDLSNEAHSGSNGSGYEERERHRSHSDWS
jgi:hypothetical protein